MAKPILLVLDDEPHVLNAVERDLRRHFGRDYRILKAGSGDEALATLRAALAMIVAYSFVPLALEGFTTAYALAPAVTGDRLLAVAAHHPAARYHTRRRAGGLLQAREAGGGARGPASEPKRAAVAGLTPDALLTLACELDQRLGSAHVQVTEP